MEQRINQVLESIGLNKNEIKAYLDLLKHNNSSALEISKRTGIHRPNTYDTLRELINKGFVKEIVDQKKRLFTAMNPEKLNEYLKNQVLELNDIMPALKMFSSETPEQENVSLEKGIFSVRESLRDLLKLNQPINIYGASQVSVDSFGEGFLKEFHKERIKKKIIMRHIYDETAIERVRYLNTVPFTEARYLPKKYSTIASTAICGDTVLLIIFSSPFSAIKIKNKAIADTYNQYFELLYRDAKVLK